MTTQKDEISGKEAWETQPPTTTQTPKLQFQFQPISSTPFPSLFNYIDNNEVSIYTLPQIPLELQKSNEELLKQLREISIKSLEEIENERDRKSEKEEISYLSKEADYLLENLETIEILVSEFEGKIKILKRSVEKGIIEEEVVIQYIEACEKITENLAMIKEEIEKERIEAIPEKLDIIQENLPLKERRGQIIESAIKKIKETNNPLVAIKKGKEISILSELEDLLKRDAEQIAEKALIEGPKERKERIKAARELIEVYIEILENIKKEIAKLQKQTAKLFATKRTKDLFPLFQLTLNT